MQSCSTLIFVFYSAFRRLNCCILHLLSLFFFSERPKDIMSVCFFFNCLFVCTLKDMLIEIDFIFMTTKMVKWCLLSSVSKALMGHVLMIGESYCIFTHWPVNNFGCLVMIILWWCHGYLVTQEFINWSSKNNNNNINNDDNVMFQIFFTVSHFRF